MGFEGGGLFRRGVKLVKLEGAYKLYCPWRLIQEWGLICQRGFWGGDYLEGDLFNQNQNQNQNVKLRENHR